MIFVNLPDTISLKRLMVIEKAFYSNVFAFLRNQRRSVIAIKLRKSCIILWVFDNTNVSREMEQNSAYRKSIIYMLPNVDEIHLIEMEEKIRQKKFQKFRLMAQY